MPGTVTAREMLVNGMRPESWTARDRPYLINCRNLRPTPDGLKSFIPITPPVSDSYITGTLSETKSWPFPQYFEGKAVALLCFSDAIYTVNVSAGTATLIDTKDPDDDTSASITSGGAWHFADLYSSWMLFNGSCVIWKTGRSANVYVSSDVTMKTGCAHKSGRLLTGGFDPDDFYSRCDWPTFWAAQAQEDLPDGFSSLALTGMDTNWVRWSSFMAPDMLDLLDTDDLEDEDRAIKLLWRNEAGGIPMPWSGTVQGLTEFGNGVVCYGTGGVAFLDPVGKIYAPRQFAGLGMNIGIEAHSTVRTRWAGNSAAQYFVDQTDELWRLTPDLRAEHLGFREYITALSTPPLLAYDGANDELYMGDGTTTFLLSRGRLCRAPWMPTTVFMTGRYNARGIYFNSSDPTTVQVESGTFTTESGTVETLSRVWLKGLNTSASTKWTLKIKSRVRGYDDWTTSAEISEDSRNVWTCAIPVLEWRFVLESTTRTAITLEDVQASFGFETPSFATKLAAATPGAATE